MRRDPCSMSVSCRLTEVRFGDRRHTYDVRQGKYLGNVNRLKRNVTGGVAQFFARMPYRVKEVRVDRAKKTFAQGEWIEYRARVEVDSGRPGTHVLRVRVLGPDGKERRHYGKVLSAERGTASARIPLALNDAVGTWRIIARDVASGAETSATFRVADRGPQ